jgi:hypothetical protein
MLSNLSISFHGIQQRNICETASLESAQPKTKLDGNDANQVKANPDKDKGNNRTLNTS